LSPAFLGGERAALLFRPEADFALARQLRSLEGAPLGEIFSFLSGLYFRGKVAYGQAFGKSPEGLPAALVISPGEGLRFLHERITRERLQEWAQVAIDEDNPRFTEPLLAHAVALEQALQDRARFVLLGSVATDKYVRPLGQVFGERLLFPREFVGRGDMSRGSLMLRAARAGAELEYVPVARAARHGPRAAGVSSRASARRATTGMASAAAALEEAELPPAASAELELLIFIGLPGSGKSSFFEQRFSRTHYRSSKDELRLRRLPVGSQLALLRGPLSAQQSVVIDDTNLTRELRAALIAEGQRHGARVVAYFFDCPAGDCIARNRARTGRARIPDAAIFASAKRLQPPSLDEGFDEIHVVRALPGCLFELV
jgi:predicted kinase